MTAKSFEHKRSEHWPAARKAYLSKHPKCFVCLGTEKVEVHHKQPFHLKPELELDEKNLITLCENEKFVNCHLFIGHLGNFRGFNPDVEQDAKIWRVKLLTNKARINATHKKELKDG